MSRVVLNVRLDKETKKQLKLISVYEDLTVTEIVEGFIDYGLKVYDEEKRLINNK